MRIIDAQIHIWNSWNPTSRYIETHRHPRYSADDVLREMDRVGVARAVLVPPGWDIVETFDDHNHASLEAARQHPDRLCVAGLFSPEPPSNPAMIADWLHRTGMRSMRLSFTGRDRAVSGTLHQNRANWAWPLIEKADIPVMIRTAGEVPLIGRIAQRHPGLRLVVDHMAAAHFAKDAAAFSNQADLLALARFANVSVKLTGIPDYTSAPYPFANTHVYIRQVYDAFGPDRLFWGSDFTRLSCTYQESISLFVEELTWLSASDKEKIMGASLSRWLGWT